MTPLASAQANTAEASRGQCQALKLRPRFGIKFVSGKIQDIFERIFPHVSAERAIAIG